MADTAERIDVFLIATPCYEHKVTFGVPKSTSHD